MKRTIVALLSFVALSLAARVDAKDSKDGKDCPGRPFVGLWEGIDPADGGFQDLSIRQEADCSFKLLLRDTYLTLCGGTDRGLSEGTGQLDGAVLRADDLTLQCFNNNSQTSVASTFTLDRRQGILIRNRIVLTPIVIYHRVSR